MKTDVSKVQNSRNTRALTLTFKLSILAFILYGFHKRKSNVIKIRFNVKPSESISSIQRCHYNLSLIYRAMDCLIARNLSIANWLKKICSYFVFDLLFLFLSFIDGRLYIHYCCNSTFIAHRHSNCFIWCLRQKWYLTLCWDRCNWCQQIRYHAGRSILISVESSILVRSLSGTYDCCSPMWNNLFVYTFLKWNKQRTLASCILRY